MAIKRGFGKPVSEEQRALRDLLYRIIARHFHEEIIDTRPRPETVPGAVASQTDLTKPFRRTIRTMLWAPLVLLGLGAGEVDAQPADLAILAPTEGEIVRTRDFTLLYSMSGDLEAARLDHVHWQLTGGDNNTAPDLSGIVGVTAPNDGHFSLTVYMANPEHVPLHVKRTVHFQVITMGVVLLSPAQGSLLSSSDLSVGYSPFGEAPPGSTIRVGIDGRETVDGDADGSLILRGVSNGAHVVTVRLADTLGETIGESGQATVVIRSALTRQNAARALRVLANFERFSSRGKRDALKRARAVLTTMSRGGAVGAGDRDLVASNVRRALGLIGRCERNMRDADSRRALRRLLKKMSS